MISAMKTLALAASVLGLALAAPAGAEALPSARQGPALWKIADEDTTIYLFGTIHILPDGVDWFEGDVPAAFERADELVTETDMELANAAQPRALALARLPEGTTARSLMGEEARERYEAAIAQLKLPAETLDRFEPWFIAVNLNAILPLRNGYRPDSGVDNVLTGMASGKRRTGLETIDFQLGLLDGMPMEIQLAQLDKTARWAPLSGDFYDMLVGSWLRGDVEALAVMVNWNFDDAFAYDRMVVSRNADWAEWIERRLDRPGTVFVAVGAGHLAGRGSLQEQLSAHGIETARVQ